MGEPGDPDVTALVQHLGLQPHPEGGYYAETWRSDRELGTAIYYLLTPDGFSAMHRLLSDEIWHHYAGSAVEMLLLDAGGDGRCVRLGSDLEAGERPQVHVERGTWQGARVVPGGVWSLVGCTVTPAFRFEDFELGVRAALEAAWPAFAEGIAALTR